MRPNAATSVVLDTIRDQADVTQAPFTMLNPVGYDELSRFLDTYLPRLMQAKRGGELVKIASQAVKEGLPQLKGGDAKLVAESLIIYAWRKAAKDLPAILRPFSEIMLQYALSRLEGIYQKYVKSSK